MSLMSEHNLTRNLALIKTEMNKYTGMSHIDLFNYSINRRLMYTLQRYDANIDQLSDFILNQAGMRVLKAITKIQKFDDRKVIHDNMKEDINDEHSD